MSSRTTPGACIGCGCKPRPPRTAWPAHPAYREPMCLPCQAIEAGVPYVEQTAPEPLAEGETMTGVHVSVPLRRGADGLIIIERPKRLEPIDVLERETS